MDSLIVFGASYLYILSGLVAGIFFLVQPRPSQKRLVILGILSAAIAGLLAFVAGKLYVDPRPFVAGNFVPLVPHAADNGFPSDHSLLVGLIAALVFAFDKRVGTILWIVAIAVGTSRVLAGVHHPVDVFGSFLISIAAVVLGEKIVRVVSTKKKIV